MKFVIEYKKSAMGEKWVQERIEGRVKYYLGNLKKRACLEELGEQ
jgi:hypothetical protein